MSLSGRCRKWRILKYKISHTSQEKNRSLSKTIKLEIFCIHHPHGINSACIGNLWLLLLSLSPLYLASSLYEMSPYNVYWNPGKWYALKSGPNCSKMWMTVAFIPNHVIMLFILPFCHHTILFFMFPPSTFAATFLLNSHNTAAGFIEGRK